MKLSRLALLLGWASIALTYNVPQGSPGFYHGNSTAAVTFDDHSLFLNGKRLFVFSGEIHPWRSPTGVPAWRDLLQKMKAAGFNAVSIYHHWGISEGKRGSLNFDHFRSHVDFYQVAKEVGVLVVARIGPYVNAETTAGGFPGWLTNEPARARSNETGFTEAWLPWIEAAATFIEPYQYPDGPIIAVQVENEYWEAPGNNEHMQLVEDSLRRRGVVRVPLMHNDNYPAGNFVNGTGAVDLYTWDDYPQQFFCADPDAWKEIDSSWLDTKHKAYVPDVMWASAEYQGGAFDHWGGYGYDQCYLLTNEQFANVQYKNNYASQTTWLNLYMLYGGTNWGNLAEPDVYTSYDYAAPIREDHTLSPKYSEIKLHAGFLHASPDFLVANRIGNGTVSDGTAFSDNPRIYTTVLQSKSGVNFYIVRQTSVKSHDAVEFKLRVNTTEGEIIVPQYGDLNAILDGRESQILVSEYPYGSYKLVYSTAEIFTWTTIGDVDYLVLYAELGHPIEVMITGNINNMPVTATISETSNLRAYLHGGDALVISGKPSGMSVVNFGASRIIIVDKHTALSFWNMKLLSEVSIMYDQSIDVSSVIVAGPYLVRNATLAEFGSQLLLNGDLNDTTTLDIFAPTSVQAVFWNGNPMLVSRIDYGHLQGKIVVNLEKPLLPSLREAEWFCTDSLPEVQDGFYDNVWLFADKTKTARPYQPFDGKYILYADEYGFHQGNSIYRGHFHGRKAMGVWLSVEGGFNFGYSVWLNSKFLGSGQGTNSYEGGVDKLNDTWYFDPADLHDGDNVLTVVLDPTGLYEDYGADDLFKSPRGIRGYKLLGLFSNVDFDYWKIQGNFGGENVPDTVRGPLNEGGLFVERQGAHLPGFPAAEIWGTSSACTPYSGISKAGIFAYRTSFDLDISTGLDVPIALKFERTPESSYRSVIYVNGWQFGRFNSKDGPQVVFPIPRGILNHGGKNELLITLWSLDAKGAKIADLELISTAVIASTREVIHGTVESPTYTELRTSGTNVAQEGEQKVMQVPA